MAIESIAQHLDSVLQAENNIGRRFFHVQSYPPANPANGDIWLDTTTDTLKVFEF